MNTTTNSPTNTPTEAAVLIPLFLPQGPTKTTLTSPSATNGLILKYNKIHTHIPLETTVLLTIRSHSVEHHKGQISFPGGVRDPEDNDLIATALRETNEETGLQSEHISVLGTLDPVHTASSNFLVTPVLGTLIDTDQRYSSGRELSLSSVEIAATMFVPITELINPKNKKTESYTHTNGSNIILPAYYYGEHRIWGATALMIQKLLSLISQ